MNLRQLPVIPTIVVLAAVATMIALGIWQLGRAEWKAELIAKYEAAIAQDVLLPSLPPRPLEHIFSKVSYDCEDVERLSAVAGRSAEGRSGYSHIARCHGEYLTKDQGTAVDVAIGWERAPNPPDWDGGSIEGMIAPGGELGWRIVADPPLAGLEPLAKPDPSDLPNNHLAYAGQWFFFALTALIIYWFAIQSRLKERREE